MEPNYFFFLILPLAILVFFLVGVVIYNSRKEEDDYEKQEKKLRQQLLSGKIDRKKFTNFTSRVKYVKHFNSESKKLLALLSDEKIDEETYGRLMQVLESSFKNRLDKLEETTNSGDLKKPFEASKF
ncbi:MAG: hypothetical protein NWF06_05725 [Candidatus Bathyarchaeota archaeon]|nr:hypothetical protein [Candidatus Bathyarchaeum sp.]